MNHLHFGKRLFKTTIAVFITAQICYLLNWPMIFAVIAAIVSIEPTVNASIQKGVIRLPSAAIGAAFAMIFDALLGSQPLTFTLSALATIYVCNLLRWNHTIIIATLTAVNMISVSEAHFLIEFLVRLGTTTTGIVVSAAVNYLLFRPDYSSELRISLNKACQSILHHAHQVLNGQVETGNTISMTSSLNRIQTLLEFQISDYRFKRTPIAGLREIVRARRSLRITRHVLFYMETVAESKDANERTQCLQMLATAVQQLDSSLLDFPYPTLVVHHAAIY